MSKFDKFGDKFDAIRGKLEKKRSDGESRQSGGYDDSWKFKPSLPNNKTKVTYNLRILPNIHSESGEPWILGLYHMYRKEDGKFIYTLCPSTTGGKDAPCPFCEKAKKLYANQNERDNERAQKVYKKKRYFANVQVISDPRSGEENQEGKTLVWEFGKSIYDKLEEALIDKGINFFHPTEGRNFELTIKKKGEYNNYDSSQFALEESPISEDEDEMDTIFEAIYNLEEKVFGKGPKDYDKLVEMLTGTAPEKDEVDNTKDSEPEKESEDSVEDTFEEEAKEEESEKEEEKPVAKTAAANSSGDEDDFEFDFDNDDD